MLGDLSRRRPREALERRRILALGEHQRRAISECHAPATALNEAQAVDAAAERSEHGAEPAVGGQHFAFTLCRAVQFRQLQLGCFAMRLKK